MVNQRQAEWESSLNWPEVGPKLIAALEDIDSALHTARRPTAEAKKIVDRIFKEIGRPTRLADTVSRPIPGGSLPADVYVITSFLMRGLSYLAGPRSGPLPNPHHQSMGA
jgi:hypothetical protein